MTPPRIPVLLYHSVSDDCDPRFREWAVAPGLFAAHMAHVAESGYRAVTVRELVAELAAGGAVAPRTVAITFDDGLADVHSAAWPALSRHGLTATVFIATGYVGRTSSWLAPLGEDRRPMLTWPQIAELDAAGIECAAHGDRHLQLDTVGASTAWSDITTSRQRLQEVVGPVDSFAYPHGYYTRRLQRQVARAGFASACAVKDAMSAPDDDRFAIARIVVRGGTGVEAFGRMLRGEDVPGAPPSRTMRRGAWRAVRRAGAEPIVRRIRERGGRDHSREVRA